jgi:inner membrane protein
MLGELLTGTTFLLWPAVAAWITGALLFLLPLPFPAQLLAFGALTLCCTFAGRRYMPPRWLGGGHAKLNEPALDLLGKTAVAAAPFVGGEGRVKLGDGEWRAESAGPVLEGELVRIVAVSGATLKVERVHPPTLAAPAQP